MAFGALFVESLGSLFPDPLLRAAFAIVGLAGALAMLIYRTWLWERFRALSGASLLGAIITLLLVLALSPYAQQRRWPFVSWFATSSSPKIEPNTFAPPAVVEPNPLHDEITKWRLVQGLSILANDKSVGKFKIVVFRYQLPYAETFYDDLKEVLIASGWEIGEKFATGELERGLSTRIPPNSSGDNVRGALMNAANGRWPGGWSIPNPSGSADADEMKNCNHCIEVNIGNPPQ